MCSTLTSAPARRGTSTACAAASTFCRRIESEKAEWYKGTANAIYQNIQFLEDYDPEYVLILSGDHIYKMDYNKMLQPAQGDRR